MKTTAIEKRKYEVTTWLDMESPDGPDPKYGIRTRLGRGGWMHCGKDRALILFDTASEAKAHIPELRRRFSGQNAKEHPTGATE